MAQTMAGIMSIHMPVLLDGFNYLSPLRYMVRNLAPYTLNPITLTCNNNQRNPDGTCFIPTGKDVLKLWELDTDPAINIALLGVCTVVYRVLAYVLLKVARTHWGEGKQKQR